MRRPFFSAISAAMKITRPHTSIAASLGIAVMLAGCSSSPDLTVQNDPFPTDPRDRRVVEQGSLFGEDGLVLFGGNRAPEPGSGIGVNSFLWRASLDTVAFMPVASADPFGGVILTDWYAPSPAAEERFKLNIFILDRQLRADGVRVAVFRQVRERGEWVDAEPTPGTANILEETILTRARELRVISQAQ